MYDALEAALGYRFKDRGLLENALTHSSYANERWKDSLRCNERLEFLGDSVLGMITAQHLYKTLPDRPEGDLSRIRADLVCEKTLAKVAEKLHLGEVMLLGHGEDLGDGRHRPSILADAVESIIAAAFLDGGFEAAQCIVHRFVLVHIPTTDRPMNADYKTQLQELVQRKRDQVIHYQLVGEEGPDHAKQFTVEVLLNGKLVGEGRGSSKKRAEQDAARRAIEVLFPNEK